MTTKRVTVPLFAQIDPQIRATLNATATRLGTTSASLIEKALTVHLLELSNSPAVTDAPDNSYEAEISKLSESCDDFGLATVMKLAAEQRS